MESMLKNAFEDIYSCLYFNNNWDDREEWEDNTQSGRHSASPTEVFDV
jgi:hypothetical protein